MLEMLSICCCIDWMRFVEGISNYFCNLSYAPHGNEVVRAALTSPAEFNNVADPKKGFRNSRNLGG